jgi:Beta-ketoacyl synthase, N-terminal domain
MEDQSTPLAIIGMATRFPQEATSNEELWKFLLKGRSAHSPFPEDRIHPGGHYHPDPEHGGTVGFKRRDQQSKMILTAFSLLSREAIFCPRTRLILTRPFST